MDRTSLKAQLSQKIILCLCMAIFIWATILIHESIALRYAPYGSQLTVSILKVPLTTLEKNLTEQGESLKFHFHSSFAAYLAASIIFGAGLGIISTNRYKRIKQRSLEPQDNTVHRKKARP